MLNVKRLFVVIAIFSILFGFSTFAYSGVLDTFQGYDFSNAGKFAVDSFYLDDNDFYVKIRIDDSLRWTGGGTAGMVVEDYKKNWLGGYTYQSSATFFKTPYDTSYSYIAFTGRNPGTHRLYFSSYYYDSVDFSGVVYDNN